jgi:hypothetical protein
VDEVKMNRSKTRAEHRGGEDVLRRRERQGRGTVNDDFDSGHRARHGRRVPDISVDDIDS